MTNKLSKTWTQLLFDAVNEPGIMSRAFDLFYNRSLGNMLLLMMQFHVLGMKPSPVMGFKQWLAQGRRPVEGSKALVQIVPSIKRNKVDPDKIDAMWFTARGTVFPFSKTRKATPADYERQRGVKVAMPDLTKDTTLESATPPAFNMQPVLDKFNVEIIPFDHVDGNVLGYARRSSDDGGKFKIAINEANPLGHAFRTTIHEIAHHALGHTAQDAMVKQTREIYSHNELEAEAVALLVADTFDRDPLANAQSRAYIQNWYGKGNVVEEKTAKRIFKVADQIVKAATAE